MILARTHTQIQMSCLICCAHRIGRVCFVFVRTYVYFSVFFSRLRAFLNYDGFCLLLELVARLFVRFTRIFFWFVRSVGRLTFFVQTVFVLMLVQADISVFTSTLSFAICENGTAIRRNLY